MICWGKIQQFAQLVVGNLNSLTGIASSRQSAMPRSHPRLRKHNQARRRYLVTFFIRESSRSNLLPFTRLEIVERESSDLKPMQRCQPNAVEAVEHALDLVPTPLP